MITQRRVAMIFGVILVGLGILAFIPNTLIGDNGIFTTNLFLNVVHLVTGAAAIMVGMTNGSTARTFNLGLGAFYALLGILGLIGVAFLVNALALSTATSILHLLLGAALITAGVVVHAYMTQPTGRRHRHRHHH